MADRAVDRIGIGEEEQVAVFDRAVIIVEKAADERAELADDHPPLMVRDQGKGVALLADAGRHRGADEGRVHFDPGVAECVLDHLERHRIDRAPFEGGGVGLDDVGWHGWRPFRRA